MSERTWVTVEVDAGAFAILAPPAADAAPTGAVAGATLELLQAAAKGTLAEATAAAAVVECSLCESAEPTPGAGPFIRLFPSWPTGWDARFELLCEGGFRVSAAVEQGAIAAVEVVCTAREQMGAELRLWNPWGEDCPVRVVRKGESHGVLRGPVLRFRMSLDDRVRLEPVAA